MSRVALVVTAVVALLAAAPAGGLAASPGRIAVTLERTFGVGQLCAVDVARAKAHGVNGDSIVGQCGRPNSHRVAVMRRVPAGRWGIVMLYALRHCAYPRCSAYKLVTVKPGRTTRLKWAVPRAR